MRWPRVTIRRQMAVILIAGVALGLATPGYQAWRDPEWHCHTFVKEVKPASTWIPINRSPHDIGVTFAQPSTWTRYYGRFRGSREYRSSDCGAHLGLVEEACTRAYPDGTDSIEWWKPMKATPRQEAELDRLNRIFTDQFRPSTDASDARR